MSKRLRKDDKVIVIAGNDLGKVGKVLSIDHDNGRILIEGVNIRKKTVKKSQENPQGGILDLEMPIHISNVQAVSEAGEPVKLRVRFNPAGEKEIYYRSEGKEILYRAVKDKKNRK